ncbi:hypothetical protein N7U49_19845 [Streptomyces sp. AD2-2]|nr:hypothetical protein N7U49_19845 [Streptomyces sp. AD2-2]
MVGYLWASKAVTGRRDGIQAGQSATGTDGVTLLKTVVIRVRPYLPCCAGGMASEVQADRTKVCVQVALQGACEEGSVAPARGAQEDDAELPPVASAGLEGVAIGAERDHELGDVVAAIAEFVDVVDLKDGRTGVCAFGGVS